MIDLLKQKTSSLRSREEKYNVARESLQILLLKLLADAQAFKSIAFIGGTALRIIFHVRRYSEDLDFSIINPSTYDFDRLLRSISTELDLMNVPVDLKSKRGVVDSCMLNFTSVLQELGIAIAKDQKLSIKLEIDTNLPLGATTTDAIVNQDYIFPVRHFDTSSLMSVKFPAVMFRKYSKGRDYYDLIWYLTRKVQPNLILLESAIYQTEKTKMDLKGNGWGELLIAKVSKVDFKKIRNDVAPFIEDVKEVRVITKDNIIKLIDAY